MEIYNKLYIYLLIGGGSFIILLVAFLFNKIVSLNVQLSLLSQHNSILNNENHSLSEQKLKYIQKIEHLIAEKSYLNQIIVDREKLQRESFNSAKAALFDLGGELSKQLIEIHKKENQETRQLSEKNIAATAEKFTGEFERLINMIGSLNKEIEQSKESVDIIKQSLLSPASAGKLAEITLENMLKTSGLRDKIDYYIQYNLTTLENTKLRPDALIFLPADNLMIIDAKASKFLIENDSPLNLIKTMNLHLKSLSSKEYVENSLENFKNQGRKFSNTITLMFLPTEQAIEKINDADINFMQKAWSANIFPVGPAGLMNMLSFAKFQISDYRQAENYKLIIEEVQKLLQSTIVMADHSQKMGLNIQSIVNNYDKFAASFNRNFLSKAKNIQRLGVNSGKGEKIPNLPRYQLISSKSELIEAEPLEEVRELEEI